MDRHHGRLVELLLEPCYRASSSTPHATLRTVRAAGAVPRKQHTDVYNPAYDPFASADEYDLVLTFVAPAEIQRLHPSWYAANEAKIHHIPDIQDADVLLTPRNKEALLEGVALARAKDRVLVLCNGGNNRSRMLASFIRIERGEYTPGRQDPHSTPYFQKMVEAAYRTGSVRDGLEEPVPERARRGAKRPR